MNAKPSTSILLRLPPPLAVKIRKEAREIPTSANSLIIKAIELYFSQNAKKSNLETQKLAVSGRQKARNNG